MRTGRMIAGLGLGLGLGMLREGANYRQLMIKAGKEPTFDDFWSKSIFGKKKEAPNTEEGVKEPVMSPKATLETVNKDASMSAPAEDMLPASDTPSKFGDDYISAWGKASDYMLPNNEAPSNTENEPPIDDKEWV